MIHYLIFRLNKQWVVQTTYKTTEKEEGNEFDVVEIVRHPRETKGKSFAMNVAMSRAGYFEKALNLLWERRRGGRGDIEVAKIKRLPRYEDGFIDLGSVTKLHFPSTRYTIGNLSVFVEETTYKSRNVQGGYESLTLERVGYDQKDGKEKKPIQMNIPIGLMGGLSAALSYICERRNVSVNLSI